MSYIPLRPIIFPCSVNGTDVLFSKRKKGHSQSLTIARPKNFWEASLYFFETTYFKRIKYLLHLLHPFQINIRVTPTEKIRYIHTQNHIWKGIEKKFHKAFSYVFTLKDVNALVFHSKSFFFNFFYSMKNWEEEEEQIMHKNKRIDNQT